MMIKYNSETDLMYIHFFTGISNVQIKTSNSSVSKFVAKNNKEQIVGYEIENASSEMKYILDKIGLNRKQKLAVSMSFIRERQKKTQKEFSTLINISESTYKSIEKAEHNIAFDTLDIIYNHFKKEEVLSNIFN